MRSLLKLFIINCAVIGMLCIGIAVYAGNVAGARHPNLAATQTLIEEAIHKVSTALAMNEVDVDGHAAKAKALLDQAYDEIKLAAVAANARQ